MAYVDEKLTFLQDCLEHPGKYLPIVDHAWQTFPVRNEFDEVNIGWNAGLIDGKRPYFCECWADGCTVITYFISTKGIEDYTVGQLEEMLSNADIISYNCQEHYEASAMTFTDHSGNEFYSVNMVVGDEEKTYTDGGMIFSFSYLNKFNQKRNEASTEC